MGSFVTANYGTSRTAVWVRLLCFGFFFALIGTTVHSAPVSAASGINEQIGYQARLLTGSGAVVPDGTYNMEFKIYQDGHGCVSTGSSPCGGTLKWTETRTGSDKVTVKNGYFSVQLGSVTAFGTSVDWNQDTLWLSINIGGTSTPSWDGEMLPFRRLSAVPYALNAGRLGGLDASKFLQVAPSSVQVDSGTLNSIYLNKTGASGNILNLQKNGTSVFVVDNNGKVALGSSAPFSKFEVQDGDLAVYNSGNNARMIIGDTSTSGQYGYLQWDSANDYFRIETAGSNGLKINDNFVSIGNIFPDSPLKVASGSTLLMSVGTTGNFTSQASTDATDAFRVLNSGGTTVLRVDTTTGRLAIGNITPSYPLDVVGDINTSTQLRIGGTIICTSSGCTPTGSYINNQNSIDQTADFRISGSGRAAISFLTPLVDTASAVALNFGTTNATAINLNKGTTITGGLTQSGGVVDMTSNGAAQFITSSGGITIRAFNTNTVTLNTSGAGTVNLGTGSTTTVNIGRLGDFTRTINIGNTGGTAAQTVIVGNNTVASTLTLQGGTGTNAVTLQAATNGSINATTTGTGNINLTANGEIIAKSTNDTATSFRVQDSTGGDVVTVDTLNNRVGINGITAPATSLDVSGAIQQTGLQTLNTNGTDNGKWQRLGYCLATYQYYQCLVTVDILGGQDGTAGDNTQATVSLRVKQQNALGGAPIVDLQLNGVAQVVTKDDFKAVTTQNDATATVVGLYGRIPNQYDQWYYSPVMNTGNYGTATFRWTPGDPFAAALPAGTQTAATYGDLYGDVVSALTSISAPTLQGTTSVQTPLLDAIAAGALNIGTTNATAINLNKGTTITGGLTQSAGAISLAGTTTTSISAATGTLSITGATSNTITVTSGTSGTLNLSSGTGGTINLGTGASTVAIAPALNGVLTATTTGTGAMTFTTAGGLTMRTSTNSTTGIRMLDSANNVIFNADTTNTKFSFGSNATTTKHVSFDFSGNDGIMDIAATGGNLHFQIAQFANSVAEISTDADLHVIRNTNSTAGFQLLNASDVALFTFDSTNSRFQLGGGGTNFAGSRLHFGDFGNVYIGETSTTDTDALTLHANQGYSFEVNAGIAFGLTSTGAATFGNNTNSTTAFRVVNAAGTAQFTVNTTNGNVTVNASSTAYTQRLCHSAANGATTGLTLGDCNAVGQADLAEFYATDGEVEPGDVVTPSSAQDYAVKRTTKARQGNVAGIVSTNPTADGILGYNVTATNRQPITLAGRIPLKVSLEGGDIQTGDLLTSADAPGAARKAKRGDPVIAIALEDYSSTSPRVSRLVTKEEVDRAKVHKQDLPAYTSDPSHWPDEVGKIMALQRISGPASASLEGDDLEDAVLDGGVVSDDVTFNGLVTFTNATRFNGTADFRKNIAVSDNIANIATIPAGQTNLRVTFPGTHDGTPIVTATPTQFIDGSFRITNVQTNGFTIELSQAQPQPTGFNWLVVDKK